MFDAFTCNVHVLVTVRVLAHTNKIHMHISYIYMTFGSLLICHIELGALRKKKKWNEEMDIIENQG